MEDIEARSFCFPFPLSDGWRKSSPSPSELLSPCANSSSVNWGIVNPPCCWVVVVVVGDRNVSALWVVSRNWDPEEGPEIWEYCSADARAEEEDEEGLPLLARRAASDELGVEKACRARPEAELWMRFARDGVVELSLVEGLSSSLLLWSVPRFLSSVMV